ncbi:WD40-repeat-containing domain protein [Baffinella frigidus]|nr:WD40-repeat-containing domain protein [Cryptophyta sp. CCMP2293]
MHDLVTSQQRFFTSHTHTVSALAVHPVAENQVVSADVSGKVYVWMSQGVDMDTNASSTSSYSRTTLGTQASRAGLADFKASRAGLTGFKVQNKLQVANPTALCFSADGSTLAIASAGLNGAPGCLSIFDLGSNKRIAFAECPALRVLALAAHPDGRQIVAVGERHVRFWALEKGGNLKGEDASFGAGQPQTMLCVAFCAALTPEGLSEAFPLEEARTITGAQNGCAYIWDGPETLLQIVVLHQGPVLDLVVEDDGIYSAGADGLLRLWETDWSACTRLDIGELTQGLAGHANKKLSPCMSVAIGEPLTPPSGMEGGKPRTILVGLETNEIVELVYRAHPSDLDDLPEAHPSDLDDLPEVRVVVQGQAAGELRAVVAHPTSQEVATLGDGDGLRLWSVAARTILHRAPLPSPGLCVAYWLGGGGMIVGLANGMMLGGGGVIVGLADGRVLAVTSGAPSTAKPQGGVDEEAKGGQRGDRLLSARRTRSATALAVNEEAQTVAVGYANGVVDILSLAGGESAALPLAVVCTGKGPSGAIDRLDWSMDGKVLQATSALLELAFFDRATGRNMQPLDWSMDGKVLQATSALLELAFFDGGTGRHMQRASEYRDVKFRTFNARFGWPVTGVTPIEEISLIASLSRATTLPVCAVGSVTGELSLYRFPCVSPGATSKSYRAHRSAIAALAFTAGDGRLVTVGKRDSAVLQWRLERPDATAAAATLAAANLEASEERAAREGGAVQTIMLVVRRSMQEWGEAAETSVARAMHVHTAATTVVWAREGDFEEGTVLLAMQVRSRHLQAATDRLEAEMRLPNAKLRSVGKVVEVFLFPEVYELVRQGAARGATQNLSPLSIGPAHSKHAA